MAPWPGSTRPAVEFSWRDIFGEIFDGGEVFTDEIARCRHRLAGRFVNLLPRVLAGHDQNL